MEFALAEPATVTLGASIAVQPGGWGAFDDWYLGVCAVPAHTHTEETIPGIAPTCTESGLTEGSKCSECGEIILEQEVIPASGHTPEVLPAVEPTCTSTGLTEGSKCLVCGEILVRQEDVPALQRPIVPVIIPSRPDEEIGDSDAPLAELPFIDVDHAKWYAQAVANVVARGLMEGVETLLFAPGDSMTRGMMAQSLYALAAKPEITDAASFLDLADGVNYADAAVWGAETGVIKGYSETEFGGEDALNRQQLAVLLYRYVQLIEKQDVNADVGVLEQFSDHARVSVWAEEAIAWAVANELVIGRTDGTLDPRAVITRAEAAAILDRYSRRFLV